MPAWQAIILSERSAGCKERPVASLLLLLAPEFQQDERRMAREAA
jgi:hypothetical protein